MSSEYLSWGSAISEGAFASTLKWPVGGMRDHYESLKVVGSSGHSEEVLKFYDEGLDTMKFAHLFMQQTKSIHHRNAYIKRSYLFLDYRNKELQERLSEYENV